MIKSVKHNKVQLRPDKKDESVKLILVFSRSSISRKQNEGVIVMDSFDEPSKSIVPTFLETKEDLNNFYPKDNGILANLVENSNLH
jgi:hypothetical protein